MAGWAEAVAALAVGIGLTAGGPQPVFSFQDERINESSGLADGGSVLFTVNDSGDGPVVYAVDKRTGETAGVTTYSSDEVSDVEALAPAPDGELWVGDIGDNNAVRQSVDVYRLQPSAGQDDDVDSDRYRLAYADGPRDAESLLVHPETERLYVVPRMVFGAAFYEAPATLRADTINRLEPVEPLQGVFTDGAFFPDGRHVLLRTYGDAMVYSFPDLEAVGEVDLPRQEQGEGVAIAPDGTIYVSTEGTGSEVHRVPLPADVVAAMQEGTSPGSRRLPPGAGEFRPRWVGVAFIVVMAAALGYRGFRAFRRRSPRRQ